MQSVKSSKINQSLFKDPNIQARMDAMPVTAIDVESLSFYPVKHRISRREPEPEVISKDELQFTALASTKPVNGALASDKLGTSIYGTETRRSEQDIQSEQKVYNALSKEVKMKQEQLFALVKANVMPEQQIELLSQKIDTLTQEQELLNQVQARLEHRAQELSKDLNDVNNLIKKISVTDETDKIDKIISNFNSPENTIEGKLMAFCQRIALLEKQKRNSFNDVAKHDNNSQQITQSH